MVIENPVIGVLEPSFIENYRATIEGITFLRAGTAYAKHCEVALGRSSYESIKRVSYVEVASLDRLRHVLRFAVRLDSYRVCNHINLNNLP